jgi:hypothetical protein
VVVTDKPAVTVEATDPPPFCEDAAYTSVPVAFKVQADQNVDLDMPMNITASDGRICIVAYRTACKCGYQRFK